MTSPLDDLMTEQWELRLPLRFGSQHHGFYLSRSDAESVAQNLGYRNVQVLGQVVYAQDDDDEC